ncbi:MAG: hypothetical protein M5R36_23255 [Deltaproteobacteria bacterium]|nr:hypothetical protein [Deltaproteobacteria bacterium]
MYYAPAKDSSFGFSIVLDPPIFIDLSGGSGSTDTASGSGTMDFDGADPPDAEVDYEIDIEVVDDNASITVPFGLVEGCFEVVMTTSESVDDETPFEIEIHFWIHPIFGLIRVDLIPGFEAIELAGLPS